MQNALRGEKSKMGKKLRTYYAKSANSFHGAITNREHLDKVATLARRFGAEIGKEKAAGVAGGVHDFGKYADRFQGVLSGTHQGVDHALPSAAELYRLLDLRTTQRVWADGICAVEAVAGHHDGLIGMPQMQDGLEEMLSSDDWDDCPSGKMPSLHGQEEFMQAEEAFAQDFPDFHMQRIQGKRSRVQGRLEDMLDTRMLFSCLVDADYCVSASDDDPAYLEDLHGGCERQYPSKRGLRPMRRGRRATDGSIYADGAHRCGENNGNDSFCAPPLCAAPITTDNCGASVSYIGRATPERI